MALIGLSERDVEGVLLRLTPEIEKLLSSAVLITGGSGFVGRWLIESLIQAKLQLGKKATIISLSRSTAQWQDELVKRGLLRVITADITDELRIGEEIEYVFHCATPVSALLNESNPSEMQRIIELGAKRVINRFVNSFTMVVNVSSGAVYGEQPPDVRCLDEEWLSSPRFTLPDSAYHHAKVNAEAEFNAALTNSSFSVVHTRLFAFFAPFLPTDRHLAAGNFLRDALAEKPITITGDGRTVRTYMYGTDLVEWLIAAAVRGKSGSAYNIGSPHETTIAELATKVSDAVGSRAGVRILREYDSQKPASRYVPCTTRTEQALGVRLIVDLDEAIERTVRWHRERSDLKDC